MPRIRAVLVLLAVLGATLVTAAPASAEFPPPPIGPTGFVTMADGTEIAINVRMPIGHKAGQKVPAIFEMSGYDGASNNDLTYLGYLYEEGVPDVGLAEGSRQLTKWFYANYATVHASVRGTGCSGGEFDLFSYRSALDGREVIEWIADQPWSNGKVGIMGHSYSGITGFMVAATRPPHLTAVTVSGLIDDLYRGITVPGGVSNVGFPVLWTLGVRPAYDVAGATAQPLISDDTHRAQCLANIATHRRTVVNDPVLQGVLGSTDNDWYRARSLINYVDKINVPIHIVGAYQDEQTGPRGPTHLWEAVRGVPKRLVITNGDHGTNQSEYVMENERVPWMDHWMRGVDRGYGTSRQDRTSVRVYFETHFGERGPQPNGILNARTFPLETTRWTDLYLRADGGLSPAPPAAAEGSSTWASGPGRQSWSYQAGPTFGSDFTTPEGPDEVGFRSEPVKQNLAVVGPITATLFVSATAVDTDLFVQLIDEGPNGDLTYLTRGVLKASHRALDPSLSDWFVRGREKVLYRPYRPHATPINLTPGATYEYLVEVWPVGHVFRPGHRIVVKVMAPPAVDSYYAYAPQRLPSLNTVFHEAGQASRITLPVVPLRGVKLGPEIPCGEQQAVRCIR